MYIDIKVFRDVPLQIPLAVAKHVPRDGVDRAG